MTTIAWDGQTLAADTLIVIGGMLRGHGSKIFRLDDGRLYGGSGDIQDVLAVRDWLNGGDEKPQVKDYFAAIVIDTHGQCSRLEDGLIPIPIAERCHAVGSGRDIALAAMTIGKTAVEAVTLAMILDVWTGGNVETLEKA